MNKSINELMNWMNITISKEQSFKIMVHVIINILLNLMAMIQSAWNFEIGLNLQFGHLVWHMAPLVSEEWW